MTALTLLLTMTQFLDETEAQFKAGKKGALVKEGHPHHRVWVDLHYKTEEKFEKSRECLEFIKENIEFSEEAFGIVKKALSELDTFKDEEKESTLLQAIQAHDIFKLSNDGFVYFRKKFHPIETEKANQAMMIDLQYRRALLRMNEQDLYHHSNWTKEKLDDPEFFEIACLYAVTGWVASSLRYKNSAKDFYIANREKFALPKKADGFILSALIEIEDGMIKEDSGEENVVGELGTSRKLDDDRLPVGSTAVIDLTEADIMEGVIAEINDSPTAVEG